MQADTLSINELANGHVLKRVLPMICERILDSSFCIEEYREMVGLAAVSHRWHELLQPYFYRAVVVQRVEAKQKPKSWPKKVFKRKKSGVGPQFKWQSNVENVTVAGKSRQTRELRIVQRATGAKVTFEHVLRGLGFDYGDWSGVKTIRFIGAFTQYEPLSEEDTQSACAYFLKTFPNVTDLDCTQAHSSVNPESSFIGSLVQAFLPQLHTLYIDNFISGSGLEYYPANITRVHIRRALYRHTTITHCFLASQLRYLYIDHLDQNFYWQRFLGTGDGIIEFTHLEELVLKFSYGDQQPPLANEHIRKMRFPNLKRLTVSRSFYAILELYSHFLASPLESLHIREEMDKLHYIDPELIRSVSEVDITFGKNAPWSPNGWETAFADLLGSVSLVKKARLTGTPFIFPDQILWLNLRHFTVIPDTITWTNIVNIIRQLPLLLYLEVRCTHLLNDSPDLFSLTQNHLSQLNTRLQQLSLGMYGTWADESRHNLKVLALCIPSLLKLCVSKNYMSEYEAFAQEHRQDFSIAALE